MAGWSRSSQTISPSDATTPTTTYAELITLHGGYRELPDNAFASSGTGVRAVVILADRPDSRPFDMLRELDDNDLGLAGEADEPVAFAAKVYDLSQL